MRAMAEDAVESAPADRAWAELSRFAAIVDRMRGVECFGLGCRPAADGFEFEVRIDPWSPKTARKIRRKARPLAVTVVPLRAST